MIKLVKLFLMIFFVTLSIVSAVLWSEYQKIIHDTLDVEQQGYVYTIPTGANLLNISRDLKEKGLITASPKLFYLYGRYLNKAHLIKAGQYRIKPNTTLPELLDQFIDGKVIQYPFTIIEGTTAQQLLDRILADKRLVHTLKSNSLTELMSALGQEQVNAEGQFSPETYYFSANTTDLEILKRAHELLNKELNKAWLNRADNLPYKSPYEALIMASIIEKETGIAEERQQIAGVFVRRLQKGMRLQTDPTVIYGLGDSYQGNIRKKHLRTDTPYNTYTRHGLPPTPIALASIESIEAALHPADGDSLYFVATGKEGRHVFSSNLKDHNKAVRKYQLKK